MKTHSLLDKVLADGVCDWLELRDSVVHSTIQLVDLRSPKEFHRGSIPGAINLPLLDNEERKLVGTLYKQRSPSEATQCGIEIFARKSEEFLSKIFSLANENSEIAFYCWRGGMRSKLVAQWSQAAGLRAVRLRGGYKSFRTLVLNKISELSRRQFLTLNGRTGSGKTEVVAAAIERGLPALDLEGLAFHRGSIFGDFAQPEKPSTQQNFENKLVDHFLDLRDSPIILIENENFIGPVKVPRVLRANMAASSMLVIERNFKDRVYKLDELYTAHWREGDRDLFDEKMLELKKFFSREEFEMITDSVHAMDFKPAIRLMLEKRYDKAYDKSLERHQKQTIKSFNITHDFEGCLQFIKSYLLEK